MMIFSKSLIDSLKSSECILFVGSGISMWSKLPHWAGLLNQMVEFLADQGLQLIHQEEIKKVINKGDLLTAASLCALRMRDADLSSFVNKVFRNPYPTPHRIHDLILSLGPKSFITTNYDELIEDSFFTIFKSKLSIVNNDQPIEQAQLQKSGTTNFIFKIHGSISSTKTMIISREDYRRLVQDSKSTNHTLKFLFTSRPIVYLGFGLRDPDFLILKDEIASTYHGAEREHYAIMADVGELEVEYWKKEYGINIISYETKEIETIIDNQKIVSISHDNLLTLLERLSAQVKIIDEIPQDSNALFMTSLVRYSKALIEMCDTITDSSIQLKTINRLDLYKYEKGITTTNTDLLMSEVYSLPTNLIIIGSPGTGKSFSVQKYSLLKAKELLVKLGSTSEIESTDLKQSIPVILPMKEYKGDIKKMIESRLPQNLDIDTVLEQGLLILIFDAINEAPRNLFDQKNSILHSNIQWITNLYPHNRYIITSRSINYISFLNYPVYEIKAITQAQLEVILTDEQALPYNGLSEKMKQILCNPLFLNLYLQTDKENIEITNIKTLFDSYLNSIRQKLETEFNISLNNMNSIFSLIAYNLVEDGVQQINSTLFTHKLNNVIPKNIRTDEFLNGCIKIGFIVTDIEGNISFFHQTITEYLAAYELLEYFTKNPFIIEEKIKSLTWDETIILFIGFLEKNMARAVLKKIAEKDLILATRAFAGAALKDEEIGTELFTMVYQRLKNPSISEAEAEYLADTIRNVGEYGSSDDLLDLQSNKNIEVALEASMAIALRRDMRALDKIIDCLLKDHAWRSNGFDKALILLASEEQIDVLLNHAKSTNKKDEIKIGNITEAISALESDKLYTKIDELVFSEDKEDILLAVNILGKIKSDKARGKLLNYLSNPNAEVRTKAIYGFRDKHFKPVIIGTLVDQLFMLLKDEATGYIAADHLSRLNDEDIIKEASNKIDSTSDAIEKINLCKILVNDPHKSGSILINFLNNYQVSYEKTLSSALGDLVKHSAILEELIERVISYGDDVRKVILKAIQNLNYENQKVNIEEDAFRKLFTLWEYYCELGGTCWVENYSLSNLFSNTCFTRYKDLFIEKINNEDYKHRKSMIQIISGSPITYDDIKENTLVWLLSLIRENSHENYMIVEILAKICGEQQLEKWIIPLLQSEKVALMNTAFQIIKRAERILGKRLII